MPFYFRKSVSAGPFRFNFSSGGVGASVGVRGLRIGIGPRGHYVHAGRSGFYYRATIGRAGDRSEAKAAQPSQAVEPAVVSEGGVNMVEVESGDVLAMRDESLSDLLDEINAKRRQTGLATLLGWSLAAISLLFLFVSWTAAIASAFVALLGWAIGKWMDSYRRTCVLFYDLEPDVQRTYEAAVAGFDGLLACAGRWHVEAGGVVQDLTTWKRNAGASHIVRKNPTILGYKLPKAVNCNITPPALHVGKQVLFFLPDGVLVDDGTKVGAVSYSELSIAWQDSNFIEDGLVPRDAQIISYVWKHPNKSGGPDRRFRDNRQIPVCRYEAVHLRSHTGLNELVEFSKTGVAAPFAQALKLLPDRATVSPTTRQITAA